MAFKEITTYSSAPLPGEFHEHRSWAGYSPWDRKELDKQLIGADKPADRC